MKKLLLVGLALASLACSTQLKGKKAYDRRYYGYWKTDIPMHDNLQLIIYKDGKQLTRVYEMIVDHNKCLGSGVMQLTNYVYTNNKGRIVAELIDPETFTITQSEYILVSEEKLLRVTNQDTLVLNRKH